MGNAEIDKHILAVCDRDWHKVARIVFDVGSSTGLGDKRWGYDAIGKRIMVLARKGQLEAAGNLYNWRASEVRLRSTDAG